MKGKIVNIAAVLLFLLAVVSIPSQKDIVNQAVKATAISVVVIDPGHGGMDGGAEALDGTVEKEINLKIAFSLKEGLEEEGVEVIMTRTADKGLYGKDDEGTIRTLKSLDMRERKRIIDEAGADLAVSIHLNSFTQDPDVRGAQVFYPVAGNDEVVKNSRRAAEIIQKGFNSEVNENKKRDALGKDDVFLLQEPGCPIVIAECGFLSNREELKDLKKEVYQEKISKSLEASICKYLKKNGNNNQ